MLPDLPQLEAMNEAMLLNLQWADWFSLFLHMVSLSLLSVGGAITVAPEMHHYLVEQQHWLSDTQFNNSIAIAQAAPGPNVLFIALFGWFVGISTGSLSAGLMGVLVTMIGMLLPCTTLTFQASRWLQQNRERRAVRAFKQGMVPIVTALLLSTGWIMCSAHNNPAEDWPLWLATALTALIVWRTRLHLLWLLATGALLGWYGVI